MWLAALLHNSGEAMRKVLPLFSTKGGLVLLALAFVLTLAGLHSGVNLLYLLAGAAFSLVLVSLVLASFAVAGLRIRRHLPAEATAGSSFPVGLEVSARLPGAGCLMRVEDEVWGTRGQHTFTIYIPSLGPARHLTTRYEATLPIRGEYRFRRTRCISGFPFGLAQASTVTEMEGRLLVYPRRGRLLQPLPVVVGFAERVTQHAPALGMAGDELRSVREFREGDNPRRIHWRTSAKMARLYVREMEPEREPAVAIVLDTYVPSGAAPLLEELLERAVSFAATLTEETLRLGGAVSLVALTPEPVALVKATGRAGRRRVLECLARLQPTRQANYGLLRAKAKPVLALARAAVAIFLTRENARRCVPLSAAGRVRRLVVEDAAFRMFFRWD